MTMTPPEYNPHQAPPSAPMPPAQAAPATPAAPMAPMAPAPSYNTYPPAYAAEKPMPVNTKVSDTNTYALVAIILTFIVPVAGIIFGHLSMGQIKRTGDAGRGLALTAVVYGYSVFVLSALFIIAYIGFIAVMIGSIASVGNSF